jgi:hypothetical protein
MSYYYFIKLPSTYKKSIFGYILVLSLPQPGISGDSIFHRQHHLAKNRRTDTEVDLMVERGTIFVKKTMATTDIVV